MNRKQKNIIKIAIVISILLLITIILISYGLQEYTKFKHDAHIYDVNDFKHHKKNFDIVAENLFEYFEDEFKTGEVTSIDVNYYGGQKITATYNYISKEKDSENFKKVIDDTTLSAYSSLSDAFSQHSEPHGKFTGIVVYEDRIEVRVYGPYKMIWYKNPALFELLDDGKDKVFFERLSWHWYHVMYK